MVRSAEHNAKIAKGVRAYHAKCKKSMGKPKAKASKPAKASKAKASKAIPKLLTILELEAQFNKIASTSKPGEVESVIEKLMSESKRLK